MNNSVVASSEWLRHSQSRVWSFFSGVVFWVIALTKDTCPPGTGCQYAKILIVISVNWNNILNSKRNVVILNRRHNSTTRVLHVSFTGNMQSNIILNHDCA